MSGQNNINSGSLNAIQVCPNPSAHLQALFSSVFLQRKIMLCSENTSEIGFQVVPHSSHSGISHQLGFQHWKVCFKAHSSPIHRNGKNLILHQHLGPSESAKLFPLRWTYRRILFPTYTQEQPTPPYSLPAPKLCQTPFVISPFRASS